VGNAIVEETTRLWMISEPMCPTRREPCELADKVEGANFIPNRGEHHVLMAGRSDIDAAQRHLSFLVRNLCGMQYLRPVVKNDFVFIDVRVRVRFRGHG
jgi:hypothetical protein